MFFYIPKELFHPLLIYKNLDSSSIYNLFQKANFHYYGFEHNHNLQMANLPFINMKKKNFFWKQFTSHAKLPTGHVQSNKYCSEAVSISLFLIKCADSTDPVAEN